ncbi:hypothetical protein VTL71DRAFT_4902 [Oculimacula yallundae]|uniref:Uncharacterized protein n=1 Tax=Oculimacula yallundae TaxID=86028 RepID=A0ABR4C390_9HELO
MTQSILYSEYNARNPMDIASVLNPRLDDPWSDSEDNDFCESGSDGSPTRHCSPTRQCQYNLALRPMEVPGELSAFAPAVTWSYHENNRQTLPPLLFTSEEDRDDRPLHGPRMCEVARAAQFGDQSNISTVYARYDPYSPPHRHDYINRRGSLPGLRTAMRRLEITSQFMSYESSHEAGRDFTSGKIKRKTRKSARPHSNKAYNQEQVHWMRYHFIDCDLTYAQMKVLWAVRFPYDPRDFGDNDQCFSSRLYRDNISALLDEFDRLVLNSEGKPKIIKINVRDRQDVKYEDFPFKLWEKNPEWALYWDWVMPEHKAKAQRLLDGTNLDASQLRKERSRQAIRMYEAGLPAKKGWFATPALHAAAVLKMEANNAAQGLSIT